MTQSPAARTCPACQSADCRVVGPILHPIPPLVAGVPLDVPADFQLLRCGRCDFQFKDPPIPEEKLMECYARSASSNWSEADPLHRRFDLMREMLERHAPGRTILDVGCFTGSLLHYLGPSWQRYGVEPSREAADVAKNRGIQVLADTLDHLPADAPAFDAIMAIDVVEHIAEPPAFFRQVADRLRPGGVFLVVTGDTGAASWQLEGSRYWYCSSLPEHVSFYSRPTLEHLGSQLGMKIVEYHRASHVRSGTGERAKDAAKNILYATMNRLNGLGVPKLKRAFVQRRAPMWLSASDHLFCLLQKA